jgi:spectrin beta
MNMPDEKSIMTYLAGYYQKFAQQEQGNLGNKRLQKVINFELEIQEEEFHFEINSEGLVEWIYETISKLNGREFPNSVSGVQSVLSDFKTYRTEEKPPRFLEKGNLEAQLFTIQMKLREANRNPWLVPEDKHVSAVGTGWEILEKSEHERELALREALARQEAMARRAVNFNRKSDLREQWLREMNEMLQTADFGDNMAAVTASSKKEGTLQLQINAYAERLQSINVMAQSLAGDKYSEADAILRRSEAIIEGWTSLADTMTARRQRLDQDLAFCTFCADIDAATLWITTMTASLQSEQKGADLTAAEELLQKHALDEGTIASFELATIPLAETHIERFTASNHPKISEMIRYKQDLDTTFKVLHELEASRRKLLTQSKEFQQFLTDVRDEDAWIRERMPLVMSTDLGSNVSAALMLQKKHASLIADIAVRQKTSIEAVAECGKRLLADRSYASADIKRSMESLGSMWTRLKQFAAARKTALDTAVLREQYSIESNEAESWMMEKEPFICREDFGRDQLGAERLERAHIDLIEEISVFKAIIDNLHEQAQVVRILFSISPVSFLLLFSWPCYDAFIIFNTKF